MAETGSGKSTRESLVLLRLCFFDGRSFSSWNLPLSGFPTYPLLSLEPGGSTLRKEGSQADPAASAHSSHGGNSSEYRNPAITLFSSGFGGLLPGSRTADLQYHRLFCFCFYFSISTTSPDPPPTHLKLEPEPDKHSHHPTTSTSLRLSS